MGRAGLPEIKDNVVDRMVRFFSPQKAVRRRHARMVLALTGESYKGASRSRRGLSQFTPKSGSADFDTNWDLPELRDRSRDLVRNNPISCGAIGTAENCVVGTGIRLNARVDREVTGMTPEEAKEFELRAERGFRVWAGQCDLERTLSFYELQALVFRSTLENGDVIVLMPFKRNAGDAFGLKLQVIEADRLCNPNGKADSNTLSGGVELDTTGAPIAYHILTTHPGDYGKTGYRREWDKYSAWTASGRRNVLHLFRKLRAGQHRGVPYLAPVIEPLKQIDRYTDAEIMAAVVSGMFTVFIKSETSETLDVMDPSGEIGGSSTDEDYKLDYGAMVDLAPGSEMQFADPSRPNGKFEPFVTSVFTQIGIALEMPYQVLMKKFDTSYSAARASILEAWRFFHARRAWLVRQFCEPVYEAWMTEAVARGYLYAPGFLADPFLRQAYLGAEWIGPTQGQIDPVKEVQAAEKRLGLKLTSRSEECASMTGTDWEQKVPQILYEEEMIGATAAASEENKENEETDEGNEERDEEDGENEEEEKEE